VAARNNLAVFCSSWVSPFSLMRLGPTPPSSAFPGWRGELGVFFGFFAGDPSPFRKTIPRRPLRLFLTFGHFFMSSFSLRFFSPDGTLRSCISFGLPTKEQAHPPLIFFSSFTGRVFCFAFHSSPSSKPPPSADLIHAPGVFLFLP